MLRSTKSTSSSLILSHLLPSTSIVQRLPSTSRFYAATKSSGTKTPKGSTNSSSSKKKESTSRGSGKAEVGTGDARLETIRKVLFESSPPDATRLAALALVVPSAEVHETITRAWALHLRSLRDSHTVELNKKYDSMRRAIDLLQVTDERLFELSVGGKKFQNVVQKGESGNARLEGLVPREMRVPMERPGSVVWDGEWKAPVRKV